MSRDPVIDEVRVIRESIVQEHDNDLESLFRMLEEAASGSGRDQVSPTPPEVTTTATQASHQRGAGGSEQPAK